MPPPRVLRDTADEDGHAVDTTAETPDGKAVEYKHEGGGSFCASRADSAVTDPDGVDKVRARGGRYAVFLDTSLPGPPARPTDRRLQGRR
jgi:type I restriction enzyme R subunit